MARFPTNPPTWWGKPYGGYGGAWEEAQAQAKATLMEWARLGEPRTYAELVQTVSAIPWPDGAFTHGGRQVGRLLGELTLEALDPVEDRPVVSSLVINTDANGPVGGYWDLVEDLAGAPIPPNRRDEHWVNESKAAINYYGQKSPLP